ncbi:conserved hypothetical protein [Onion yellows phytoplasma OY-M]|uniref:Uncharacterized protein n=1 Tax=Onion yellows phytoplasma (strain OY-M) TaxID=262768 RepID=Q6YPU0_ONYPE|nr:conserved hypothetical protein [Onion yellows phytoplasma OY-M]
MGPGGRGFKSCLPDHSLINYLCGRRIMAITLAFQAKDVGSIPIARSIYYSP